MTPGTHALIRNLFLLGFLGCYYWLCRELVKSQKQFENALLNRMSDFQAETFPDVKLPGTEDFEPQDETPTTTGLHIEGLDNE